MIEILVLIGAATSANVEYYLNLFNNQTNKNFKILVTSLKQPTGKDFNFEWRWIEDLSIKWHPNIRKMRHSIYKNFLLFEASKENIPYIVFFDALQIPSENLIEEHLKYLNKGFSVIGSRIELVNKAEDWKVGDKYIIDKSDSRDSGILRRINGGNHWDCNASCKYDDMVKINGYDMTFGGGGGGEDVDKGIRLERLGSKFVFNPLATMFHPNHDRVKVTYASTRRTRELEPTYHFPYHFRSSPWDPSTNGDDNLLEDEYLKCYYDERGIKRWRCKRCGEEGIVDSMHILQYNEKHTVTVSPFGLTHLKKWLKLL